MKGKRSELWNFFDPVDEKSMFACCNICKAKLSFKTSTSNLKKHIINKHPTIALGNDEHNNKEKQQNINSVSNNVIEVLKTPTSSVAEPSSIAGSSLIAGPSSAETSLATGPVSHRNECKKRWKYIRNPYNQCKRKSKFPAGSSASSRTTKRVLFEMLRFFDNIQDENIESETNEETSTSRTTGLRRDSEERSGGGTSIEGTSEADTDTVVISETRSEDERSGEEMSYEGPNGAGIDTARTREVGKNSRKRKSEKNIHTSILEYRKQREKQRQAEMRTLRAQESLSDIDGIDSFCSHMGSVLKQLPPGLRVEAKTKLFNVLTEFELKRLSQSSDRSLHSNQSCPISNSSASDLTPYSSHFSKNTSQPEISSVAKAWSEKLLQLHPQQSALAEKAINEILFEASQDKLNRYSVKINE